MACSFHITDRAWRKATTSGPGAGGRDSGRRYGSTTASGLAGGSADGGAGGELGLDVLAKLGEVGGDLLPVGNEGGFVGLELLFGGLNAGAVGDRVVNLLVQRLERGQVGLQRRFVGCKLGGVAATAVSEDGFEVIEDRLPASRWSDSTVRDRSQLPPIGRWRSRHRRPH